MNSERDWLDFLTDFKELDIEFPSDKKPDREEEE